ncbi:MAG: hypothetical protein Ct9H300mP11_29570 [Chloroflexota bacterium]|nr:MAG: hypothetical protein Ct9H300mP11_29570 [Chloroflexota bacterium]
MAENYDVFKNRRRRSRHDRRYVRLQPWSKTGIVEQMMGGASIINIEKIDNFPGFPKEFPVPSLALLYRSRL